VTRRPVREERPLSGDLPVKAVYKTANKDACRKHRQTQRKGRQQKWEEKDGEASGCDRAAAGLKSTRHETLRWQQRKTHAVQKGKNQ